MITHPDFDGYGGPWKDIERGVQPEGYKAHVLECMGAACAAIEAAGGYPYNADSYPAAAVLMTERFGYPDARSTGKNRSGDADVLKAFGSHCYMARGVIRQRERDAANKAAAKTFHAGQRFPRLIFNGKQVTGAVLHSFTPAGNECRLSAKKSRSACRDQLHGSRFARRRRPRDRAACARGHAGGRREHAMLIARTETPPPYGPPTLTGDALIAQALALLESRMVARDVLAGPADVKAFIRLRLAPYEHEVFAVLFLDAAHHPIEFREMFRGTLTQTSVYPREVVKEALALNASAVILAHNHPSGVPEPSRADELLTQTIKASLALVDVRVLDHIVVSVSGAVSFAERGLL